MANRGGSARSPVWMQEISRELLPKTPGFRLSLRRLRGQPVNIRKTENCWRSELMSGFSKPRRSPH
jgi:hypothetical protein